MKRIHPPFCAIVCLAWVVPLNANAQELPSENQVRDEIRRMSERCHAEDKIALLETALGYADLPLLGVQLEAVSGVARCKFRPGSSRLAKLLVPHKSLRLREAVVGALVELGCGHECMESVFHYMYRVQSGETTLEGVHEDERRSIFGDLLRDRPTGVAGATEARRRVLESKLGTLVTENSAVATVLLVESYGVGSHLPSDFALTILEDIVVSGICPAVTRSREHDDSATSPTRRSASLDVVIARQGCVP